jgi:hypothetical protein
MVEKPKLVPSVIGGLFLGLISAIPVFGAICCCGFWLAA